MYLQVFPLKSSNINVQEVVPHEHLSCPNFMVLSLHQLKHKVFQPLDILFGIFIRHHLDEDRYSQQEIFFLLIYQNKCY